MTLPDDQRLAEEANFADAAYAKFAQQLAINETFFRKYAAPTDGWDWRQWGAKRLGSVAGCRVLDYECGAGEETVYLAKMGGNVTSVDISPVGVNLTNARAKFVGLRTGLLEVRRLLVLGGRGLFFEHMGNSAMIESIRPKEGHYTESERPVKWSEILAMTSHFRHLEAKPFHVVSRLKTRLQFFGRPPIRRLDQALLAAVPALRHFASGVVIYIEK